MYAYLIGSSWGRDMACLHYEIKGVLDCVTNVNYLHLEGALADSAAVIMTNSMACIHIAFALQLVCASLTAVHAF